MRWPVTNGSSDGSRAMTGRGVRIRAGNNVVDATIDGLLADRASLEGRLLDLLQEESPLSPPQRPIDESLAYSGKETG
jgi:hypothetical protein